MKDECLKRPNVKPVSVPIIVYSFVPSLHLQLLQKCNTQVISFLKLLAPLVLLSLLLRLLTSCTHINIVNDSVCVRGMITFVCARCLLQKLFVKE